MRCNCAPDAVLRDWLCAVRRQQRHIQELMPLLMPSQRHCWFGLCVCPRCAIIWRYNNAHRTWFATSRCIDVAVEANGRSSSLWATYIAKLCRNAPMASVRRTQKTRSKYIRNCERMVGCGQTMATARARYEKQSALWRSTSAISAQVFRGEQFCAKTCKSRVAFRNGTRMPSIYEYICIYCLAHF